MPTRTSFPLPDDDALAASGALVDRVLDDIRRGDGRCLLIEGAAGIGKTTLLDRATARAEALGIEVRRATGDDLEAGHPWGMARRVFDRAGPPVWRELVSRFEFEDLTEAGPLWANAFDATQPISTPSGLAAAPAGGPPVPASARTPTR